MKFKLPGKSKENVNTMYIMSDLVQLSYDF